MQEKIVYFEAAGEENTAQTLRLVKERAEARGIDKVVLASSRGETAKAALDLFEGSGVHLVVIPWQFGFKEENPFASDLVPQIEAKGHRVYFSTQLFHTDDFYGTNAPKAMATILRTFGQGIKVCVEITLMACNGGLVQPGEKVVAVAGTGKGSDTAVVATAAPTMKVSSLRVHEIICKPL